MKYFSTSKKSPAVSASEAICAGLAPDGGLYLPEQIPKLPAGLLEKSSFHEMSFEVLKPYLAAEMPDEILRKTVTEAFNFPIPLRRISDRIAVLELYHGPTLAFKDFGARFLARALAYFRRNENRKLTVLVATSGDTGSAVASGFHRVSGIEVIVLYPKGKVSKLQEQQMTTLGDNITAIEIDGAFDDCQALVKSAFVDIDLREKIALTSANSINLGRLLPQMLYYFSGAAELNKDSAPVFSVPSGNLGNLSAGVIASRMGLPVKHFISATNANSVFPEFLTDKKFSARRSVQTLSNAMDVGNPSNFDRLLELFEGSAEKMSEKISGAALSDSETLETITRVNSSEKYLLDPHGAVGYLALERYLASDSKSQGIVLETAHPAKFRETVEQAIQQKIVLPNSLEECLNKQKKSIELNSDFLSFKSWLIGR